MRVKLKKLRRGHPKKWMVTFPDGDTVQFGAQGYSDYTLHKDPQRMQRYITRHKKRENWTKGGIRTAGWWSRWLLWSEPSLQKAKRFIQNKFGVYITNG